MYPSLCAQIGKRGPVSQIPPEIAQKYRDLEAICADLERLRVKLEDLATRIRASLQGLPDSL